MARGVLIVGCDQPQADEPQCKARSQISSTRAPAGPPGSFEGGVRSGGMIDHREQRGAHGRQPRRLLCRCFAILAEGAITSVTLVEQLFDWFGRELREVAFQRSLESASSGGGVIVRASEGFGNNFFHH